MNFLRRRNNGPGREISGRHATVLFIRKWRNRTIIAKRLSGYRGLHHFRNKRVGQLCRPQSAIAACTCKFIDRPGTTANGRRRGISLTRVETRSRRKSRRGEGRGGGGGEEEENPAARDLDPTFPKVCAREGRGWGALGTRGERRVKRGCPKSPGRAARAASNNKCEGHLAAKSGYPRH